MSHVSFASKFFTLISEKKTDEVIAALERKDIEIDHHYAFSSGDTPLVWAVIVNDVRLAQYLLERGANVNHVQPKYLTTPLHIAARRGLNDMCRLLLRFGADKTLREHHGLTPGELVTFTRCKAVHVLQDDVKKELGVDVQSGAYKEQLDEEFWGKYAAKNEKAAANN